jgi:hypothetical protein
MKKIIPGAYPARYRWGQLLEAYHSFLPPPTPHTASARNGLPEKGYIQGTAMEFLHFEGQDARHTRWSVLR